jgi:hypothetical protein
MASQSALFCWDVGIVFAGATNKPNQKASKVVVILLHEFPLESIKCWLQYSRDLHTSCLQRREYLTNLPLSLVKWGLSSSELSTCVLASADYSRLPPGWIIISISAWESTCQFVKGCCRNAHRFPALQYAGFLVALGSSRR